MSNNCQMLAFEELPNLNWSDSLADNKCTFQMFHYGNKYKKSM